MSATPFSAMRCCAIVLIASAGMIWIGVGLWMGRDAHAAGNQSAARL